MITHDVAIEQVSRLYRNYNPSANQQAKEAKVELLIGELKSFRNDSFIHVCDLILRESKSRTFPVIEDFVSRLHLVITKDLEVKHKFCGRCEESGYITKWQLTGDDKNKRWYRFPYRCLCNAVTMPCLRYLDSGSIPARPHNPYKPDDYRHDIFNERESGNG